MNPFCFADLLLWCYWCLWSMRSSPSSYAVQFFTASSHFFLKMKLANLKLCKHFCLQLLMVREIIRVLIYTYVDVFTWWHLALFITCHPCAAILYTATTLSPNLFSSYWFFIFVYCVIAVLPPCSTEIKVHTLSFFYQFNRTVFLCPNSSLHY